MRCLSPCWPSRLSPLPAPRRSTTSSSTAARRPARRPRAGGADGQVVVLIEPGRHLGGLTSGGLGWTDSGNKAAIGGICPRVLPAREEALRRPGGVEATRRPRSIRSTAKDDAMWTFEPHVAEQIFATCLPRTRSRSSSASGSTAGRA